MLRCSGRQATADCTATAAPSSSFNGVLVNADGSAIIVGAGGVIVTQNADGSLNAPATISYAAQDDLLAIARVNASVLFVSGTNGFLAASPDNGATWFPIATGTLKSLSAMASAGNTIVVAGAGGSLLVSRDGGNSFVPATAYSAPGTAVTANFYKVGIAGNDADTTFLGSDDGVIYKTSAASIFAGGNGGNATAIPTGIASPITGLVVTDSGNFSAASASGSVLSWSASGSPAIAVLGAVSDSVFPASVSDLVLSAGQLVAVGGMGGIYPASNGWKRLGASGSVIISGGEFNVPNAIAPTSTGVKVVGVGAFVEDVNLGSSAVTREDGWTNSDLEATAVSGSSVWEVGQLGAILHSPDGGQTWTHQFCAGTDAVATAVAIPATTGWITGVAAGSPLAAWLVSGNQICGTTDGGNTWTPLRNASPNSFYSIAALNARTVFAGSKSAILLTVDAGASWIPVSMPRLGQVIAIAPASNNLIYATDGATLSATVDGGNSWLYASLPQGSTALSISAVPGTGELFALCQTNAGSPGSPNFVYTLRYTTDRGATWTSVAGSNIDYSSTAFSQVVAASANSVFLIGSFGAVFELQPSSGKVNVHQFFGTGGVNNAYLSAAAGPAGSGEVWLGSALGEAAVVHSTF